MSETIAPVVVEPAAAPVAAPVVVETVASPAVAETPVAAPAAVPEPAAAPTESASAVKPHTDTPSLMETPAEPEKPAEPAPVEPGAEAAKYEFKFPEHIKREDEAVAAFEGLLGKAKVPPEMAQEMLDLHGQHVAKLADQMLAHQHQAFGEMRAQWRDQIKSDPILGGAGFQTAQKDVAYARDILVPKEHRADFDQWMKTTGSGDHIAMWRILHNAAKFLKEPAPVQAGSPPAGIGKSQKSGWRDLYPTMKKSG